MARRTRKSAEERFWSHVEKGPGCWVWTGGTYRSSTLDVARYGHLYVAPGVVVGAHRYSYTLHFGPIPAGMLVCHECDNPLCVNPAHLFLGTNQDNQRDRLAKGRLGVGYGQRKLTPEQRDEIAVRYQAGGISYRQLAAAYGVTDKNIRYLVRARQRTELGIAA